MSPVGTRVVVTEPYMGPGTIIGYEPIEIGGTCIFSPIIELYNGLAIGGWECWWVRKTRWGYARA